MLGISYYNMLNTLILFDKNKSKTASKTTRVIKLGTYELCTVRWLRENYSRVLQTLLHGMYKRFVVNRASNSLIPGRVIELSSVQRKPTNDCVTKKISAYY